MCQQFKKSSVFSVLSVVKKTQESKKSSVLSKGSVVEYFKIYETK